MLELLVGWWWWRADWKHIFRIPGFENVPWGWVRLGKTNMYFLGANWKKQDSRKDLHYVSKCSASARCHFSIKNKFNSNIYNLSEDFQENILGRVTLVYNRNSKQPAYHLTEIRTLLPVFSGKIFENGWLWTAGSEQSKIATCNVIRFLSINFFFGIIL